MATPHLPRKRWLLIGLVALVVVTAIAVPTYISANQTDLVQLIIDRTNGEVVPTRVEGSLRGVVTLHDVKLYAVQDLPTPIQVAHIDRATGNLDLTGLRKGKKFWPETVHVEGFTMDLRLDDGNDLVWPEFDYDDDPGTEAPKPDGPRPPPESWPELKGDPRVMEITLAGGTLNYHLPDLIEAGKPPITLEQVHATGRYTEKRALTLDKLEGLMLGAPMTVDGEFKYRRDRPYTINVNLEEVSLPDLLARILVEPPPLSPTGTVSLAGTYTGKRGSYTADARLKAKELQFEEIPITAVDIAVTYEGGKAKPSLVTITEGSIQSYGSTATINGWAALQGDGVAGKVGHLEAAVTALSLGDYLRKRDLPAYGLTGLFDGNLLFDSHGKNKWDASADLTSDGGKLVSPFSPDLRAIIAGEKQPGADDLMAYDRIALRAQAHPKQLNLDAFNLTSPDFSVTVAGQIIDPSPVALAGHIVARKSLAKTIPEYGKYIEFLPDEDGMVTYEFTVEGGVDKTEFNPKISKNADAGLKDRVNDIGKEIGEAWKKVF